MFNINIPNEWKLFLKGFSIGIGIMGFAWLLYLGPIVYDMGYRSAYKAVHEPIKKTDGTVLDLEEIMKDRAPDLWIKYNVKKGQSITDGKQ
jgi:hypothetical protein